jgi:hypothetical protein
MGSTHGGTPSPRWAIIEDSTEEFLTVPNREGGLRPPLSQEALHGALPSPVATTPWMKDILNITAAQQAEGSL